MQIIFNPYAVELLVPVGIQANNMLITIYNSKEQAELLIRKNKYTDKYYCLYNCEKYESVMNYNEYLEWLRHNNIIKYDNIFL